MKLIPESFQAMVTDGEGALTDQRLSPKDLPEGEVLIRVEYSSVNYKDMLALDSKSKVVRSYPIVPGIDLAGTVVESRSHGIRVGDSVLAHGYGIGTSQHGGYSEFASVPADWVVPLSKLDPRRAMVIGTAGFTAAMSVAAIEDAGVSPKAGQVLVTGASGGVGVCAVRMLVSRGYEVVASTGKDHAKDVLLDLGASRVVGRVPEDPEEKIRPLGKASWAAGVDTVGGKALAHLLSTTSYGGVVAASGNAGGMSLPTTVLPFILRGVTLKGIDSVMMDPESRRKLWAMIEKDLDLEGLEPIASEVDVKDVKSVMRELKDGSHLGRHVVKVEGGF